MLESLASIGQGGSGLAGTAPGSVFAAFKEMQGLKISLLAGAGAGVKNNLAAIRPEDTIVAALNNNAGTITDVSFVSGVKASGTLTFASAVNTDTFVVNGVTFTIKTAPVAGVMTDVAVGATNALMAAYAAAAINAFFGATDASVTATAAAAVVTVTAAVTGTAPNSYTLVGGARITASAATLASGTLDAGTTISPVTASGTLTFASVVAEATFVVKGVTFTVKAAPTPGNLRHVLLGASNRLMAGNARAAIQRYFDSTDGAVNATALNNVVTVRATAEGTTPNAYTLVGSTGITAGAATLAGGTVTGGVATVAATNQVILFWFDKK